jgi:hypothetical protein
MPTSIVDIEALVSDLRMAVRYAGRVGALKNRAAIDTIEQAEATLARGERPDSYALTIVLSEIATAIAPVTIADLQFGRDPFQSESQRKASLMQIALTVIVLVVLTMIGYFMHALQLEQEALASIEVIRAMQPQQKLTDLRRIAQWDKPLALPHGPQLLTDQYYQRLTELTHIYNAMQISYSSAVAARDITFFPFQNWLTNKNKDAAETDRQAPSDGAYKAKVVTAATVGSLPLPAPAPASTGNATLGLADQAKKQRLAAVARPRDETAVNANAIQNLIKFESCTEDQGGALRLPDEALRYPEWMKAALREANSDDCFQLNVLSPGGSGAKFKDTLSRLLFYSDIKDKISLRVYWFLPFLYGLLGATVFVMRNIASVRTPAVKWYTVAMRIFLGGVAGIVIGWFASGPSTGGGVTPVLSVPFSLAFLTGYGIDVLFNLLDRLNAALAETTSRQRAS